MGESFIDAVAFGQSTSGTQLWALLIPNDLDRDPGTVRNQCHKTRLPGQLVGGQIKGMWPEVVVVACRLSRFHMRQITSVRAVSLRQLNLLDVCYK